MNSDIHNFEKEENILSDANALIDLFAGILAPI